MRAHEHGAVHLCEIRQSQYCCYSGGPLESFAFFVVQPTHVPNASTKVCTPNTIKPPLGSIALGWNVENVTYDP